MLLPRSGADAASGDCPVLHDLLWVHATPDVRLEHVRVRPTDTGLEAVLFVRAASDTDAVIGVQHLLDRARGPITAHGYGVAHPPLPV
ncbi:hypothetical protein [Streptomyces salinarius]|uniref:hypothetical protein n=1 Tax=Streptomyces salinarius TaxID=2762598 RepID=UPI00164498AC|nr:hypothetical protein [Streptomyces salinarius]